MKFGQFSSLSDFFAMNGYAFEVWSALAVTVVIIALVWGHSLWRYRKLHQKLKQQANQAGKRS